MSEKYLLNRYEDAISRLSELVESCNYSAVYEIRRLTHNLYVSAKEGRIDNIDYNRLDHKIEDLTREYVRKCSKHAIMEKALDSAVYSICSTLKNPTERRVFMQDMIHSLNRKKLINNMEAENYLRKYVEKAEKCEW